MASSRSRERKWEATEQTDLASHKPDINDKVRLVPSESCGPMSSASTGSAEKKMISLLKKPLPCKYDIHVNNNNTCSGGTGMLLDSSTASDSVARETKSQTQSLVESSDTLAMKPQRRLYAKLIHQLNKDSEATLATSRELHRPSASPSLKVNANGQDKSRLKSASSVNYQNTRFGRCIASNNSNKSNSQQKQQSTLVSLLSNPAHFHANRIRSEQQQDYGFTENTKHGESVSKPMDTAEETEVPASVTSNAIKSPKKTKTADMPTKDMKIFHSLLDGSIYVENLQTRRSKRKMDRRLDQSDVPVQKDRQISRNDHNTDQAKWQDKFGTKLNAPFCESSNEPVPNVEVDDAEISEVKTSHLITKSKDTSSTVSIEAARDIKSPTSSNPTSFNGFNVSLIGRARKANSLLHPSPGREFEVPASVPYIKIEPDNMQTFDDDVDQKQNMNAVEERDADSKRENASTADTLRAPQGCDEVLNNPSPSPIVIAPEYSNNSPSSASGTSTGDFLRRLLRSGHAKRRPEKICNVDIKPGRTSSNARTNQAHSSRTSVPVGKPQLQPLDCGDIPGSKDAIPRQQSDSDTSCCYGGPGPHGNSDSYEQENSTDNQDDMTDNIGCDDFIDEDDAMDAIVDTTPDTKHRNHGNNKHDGASDGSEDTGNNKSANNQFISSCHDGKLKAKPVKRLYRSLLSGNLTEVTSRTNQSGDNNSKSQANVSPSCSASSTSGKTGGIISDQAHLKDAMLESVQKKQWNSTLRKFTYLDKSAEARTAFTFHLEGDGESPEIKYVDVVRCNSREEETNNLCDMSKTNYAEPYQATRQNTDFSEFSGKTPTDCSNATKQLNEQSSELGYTSTSRSPDAKTRHNPSSTKRSHRGVVTPKRPASKAKSSKLEKICQNLWKAKASDADNSESTAEEKSFCRNWRLSGKKRKRYVAMREGSLSSYPWGHLKTETGNDDNHDESIHPYHGVPLDLSMKKTKMDYDLPFSSYS